MINHQLRFQRLSQVLPAPFGTYQDWFLLSKLAASAGVTLIPSDVIDDRALFRKMVAECSAFSMLSLMRIGAKGLTLDALRALQVSGANDDGAPAGAV